MIAWIKRTWQQLVCRPRAPTMQWRHVARVTILNRANLGRYYAEGAEDAVVEAIGAETSAEKVADIIEQTLARYERSVVVD